MTEAVNFTQNVLRKKSEKTRRMRTYVTQIFWITYLEIFFNKYLIGELVLQIFNTDWVCLIKFRLLVKISFVFRRISVLWKKYFNRWKSVIQKLNIMTNKKTNIEIYLNIFLWMINIQILFQKYCEIIFSNVTNFQLIRLILKARYIALYIPLL